MTAAKIEANEDLIFDCLIQLEKIDLQKKLDILRNSLKNSDDDNSLVQTLKEISLMEKHIMELGLKYK